MKITIIAIILLSMTSLVLSDKADKYDMILFGDNGQVEYFRKTPIGVARTDPVEVKKENLKIILEQKFNFDNDGCKITSPEEKDLTAVEGMENFKKVLCNAGTKANIRNAKSGAFLGDVIYIENKLSVDSDNGNRQYTGLNIADKGYDLKLEEVNKKWSERIVCGYNLFYKLLEQCGEDKMFKEGKMSREYYILSGNHSFDADVDVEAEIIHQTEKFSDGDHHHTFYNDDGSIISDTNGYTGVIWRWIQQKIRSGLRNTQKQYSFTSKPRLSKLKETWTFNEKKFGVEVIDFNSQILACLSDVDTDEEILEKDFDICMKEKKFLPADSIKTHAEAKSYYNKLIQTIRKLTISSKDKYVWKVLRAHHPPVNIEDKDESIYWTRLKVLNAQGTIEEETTLISEMQKNNVKLFFGSHHHSAQFLIYDYNKGGKEYKACGAFNPQTDWSDCRFINPTDLGTDNKDLIPSTECQTKTTEYSITANALTADYLFVFITGNSGRFFDPIVTDVAKSRAMLVWGRAIGGKDTILRVGATGISVKANNKMEVPDFSQFKMNFGYSYASFQGDKLIFSFFEIDSEENTHKETANVSIQLENVEGKPKKYKNWSNYFRETRRVGGTCTPINRKKKNKKFFKKKK